MILDLSMLLPWSEIAHFPVVSIISKPHLGSYQKNFVIMNNNTAVVYDVLVHDRPKSTLRRMLSVYSGMIYMPMSQSMPSASSDSKIFARTSQECKVVSPNELLVSEY